MTIGRWACVLAVASAWVVGARVSGQTVLVRDDVVLSADVSEGATGRRYLGPTETGPADARGTVVDGGFGAYDQAGVIELVFGGDVGSLGGGSLGAGSSGRDGPSVAVSRRVEGLDGFNSYRWIDRYTNEGSEAVSFTVRLLTDAGSDESTDWLLNTPFRWISYDPVGFPPVPRDPVIAMLHGNNDWTLNNLSFERDPASVGAGDVLSRTFSLTLDPGETKTLMFVDVLMFTPMDPADPESLGVRSDVLRAVDISGEVLLDPEPLTRGLDRATAESIVNWDLRFVQAPVFDNGGPDFLSAQQSQVLPGGVGEVAVADDLLLERGKVSRLETLTAVMAVEGSSSPTARLRLYSDCNGRPGEVLLERTASGRRATELDDQWPDNPSIPFSPSVPLWEFAFSLGGVSFGPDFADGSNRLWVSVIGGNGGPGVFYWLTSGTGVVQGVQGQIRADAFGQPVWVDGDAAVCCFPVCSDYNFVLTGCVTWPVKEIRPGDDIPSDPFDYVDVENGLRSIGYDGTPNFGPRAAGVFQVPYSVGPDREICLLEAWMATTCPPENTVGELYANVCSDPDKAELFEVLSSPGFEEVGVDSRGVPVYRFFWTNPGVALPTGRNYWFSLVGSDGATLLATADFLFRQPIVPCDDPGIVEARAKDVFLNVNEFVPVSDPAFGAAGRDMAFRVELAQ